MDRSTARFAATPIIASTAAAVRRTGRALAVAVAVIAASLAATACQRLRDSDGSQALTPPNPELNFRILNTEPCTGCREFREPGNPMAFYGLPRRMISAADIAGVRLSQDQYLGPSVELLFKPEADAKILAMSESNMGKPMAVMLGDRPLRISYIRGAFSGAVQMTGYSLEQREALFREMTAAPGPAKAASN